MKKSVDFIGVGTGPFNLSIAALSHQIEELNCLFFDEHPHFSWHPGMLVPDCHMQTVFLKDLVSAVAPTNPYSFVNYLVKHKKLKGRRQRNLRPLCFLVLMHQSPSRLGT